MAKILSIVCFCANTAFQSKGTFPLRSSMLMYFSWPPPGRRLTDYMKLAWATSSRGLVRDCQTYPTKPGHFEGRCQCTRQIEPKLSIVETVRTRSRRAWVLLVAPL